MAEIILQDGAKREFADGCSLGDAVAQLSNSLAKKVLVAKVERRSYGVCADPLKVRFDCRISYV
mgnify:CR=1 FL=1